MLDDQPLAIEGGRDPEPGFAVDRGHGLVSLESFGVRHFTSVLDRHPARHTPSVAELEMEPLSVAFANVAADLQANIARVVGRDKVDVAGVELA